MSDSLRDRIAAALRSADSKIDFHGGNTWAVCKRNGRWRIYQWRPTGWSWTWECATLAEAHSEATRNAIADQLYAPGGLTRLAHMQLLWNAMRHH